MSTKVKLASTDISAYVHDRSISWGPRDLGTRIDIARVRIRGTSPVIPDDDMYLEITDPDGLTKVFAGIARQPDAEESLTDGGTELVYQVAAQGWGALLYRIQITTTEGYLAGLSDRYIVNDLLTKYYGQIGTGLTHVLYTSRWDMPAITFLEDQMSLGQALDQIAAEANGAPWWIAPDKVVHWNDIRRRAPFVISTAPDAVVRDSYRREVLADGPKRLLRFGDLSGTTATDATGISAGGTYAGSAKLGRAGLVDDDDTSVSLEDLTGQINLPHATDVALGTSSFAVEALFVHRSYANPRSTATFQKGIWVAPAGAMTAVIIGQGYDATGIKLNIGDGVNRVDALIPLDAGYRPPDWLNSVAHIVIIVDRSLGRARAIVNGVAQSGFLNIAAVTGSVTSTEQITIGTAAGSKVDGFVDEWAIYVGTVPSNARFAAHYVARVKRKVGTKHISQYADSTQQAHRVQVAGNSSSATYEATDWVEWARMQKRRADEPGAPAARMLTLPLAIDDELTTYAQAQRRAFSLLANQARRRPYTVTVSEPGLEPGQRLDVISAKYGTGATGQPTLDEALTVRESPPLSGGMGRFIVQRVEPALVGSEEWVYKVTFGDFQPTLPIVLSKSGGYGSIQRTSIAPKSLTTSEMKSRYRRVAIPIFGDEARTIHTSNGPGPVITFRSLPSPATTKLYFWTFPGGYDNALWFEVPLPEDLVMTDRGGDSRFSGSPSGVWLQIIPMFVNIVSGATGAIRLAITGATYGPGGADSFAATEDIINESFQMSGMQWQMARFPLMSGGIRISTQGPSDHPPRILRLVFGRRGTDPFDTLPTQEAALVAIELEYLADS